MPTTIETICTLGETRGLNCFVAPRGNAVAIAFRLSDTFAPSVLVRLFHDGAFVSISCHDLPRVDASHPMHAEVQELLLALNGHCRLVKFAHDQSDGEISALADVWLEDIDLTETLFNRVLNNFLDSLATAHEHLDGVIASARLLGRQPLGKAA
jgi:hypothetical protein